MSLWDANATTDLELPDGESDMLAGKILKSTPRNRVRGTVADEETMTGTAAGGRWIYHTRSSVRGHRDRQPRHLEAVSTGMPVASMGVEAISSLYSPAIESRYMPPTESPATGVTGVLRAVFGPVLALRTYKHLLYFVVAFPIAMVYWIVFGFGIFFGLFLSIVLVGLPILLLTVLFVRVFVALERWLANALLSVSLTPADDVPAAEGTVATIRAYIDAPSTWHGFGFLSLKFFLGMVGIILGYALFQGLSMLSTLVRRPHGIDFGEVNGEPVVWSVETLPEAGLAAVAGLVLVLLVVHLANGFGYAAARMATALLGSQPTTDATDGG